MKNEKEIKVKWESRDSHLHPLNEERTLPMNNHDKNTIIKARLLLLKEGENVKNNRSRFKTIKQLCCYHSISRKTYYKWYKRWLESNKVPSSLMNRSCAPRNTRKLNKTSERTIISIRDRLGYSSLRIHLLLKRKCVINPDSNKPISEKCIRNVFQRYKRGYRFDKKRKKKEVVIRYEKELPGQLGHIDTKKLKNIKGTDPKKKKYQFALVDDATRIPYVEILPNKKSKTAADFLQRAVAWFQMSTDITFDKILSDNGKEYTFHTKKGKKLHKFELMMKKLGIKHIYTKVRRPQTNGKVERFFKTLDLELHNVNKYKSYKDRNIKLKKYLEHFIFSRFHMGIKGQTPYEKLMKIDKSKRQNDKINNKSAA